ncbi:unnamed protein product [Heligmosomoides polygyrus]|uniref:RdRp catalytic domain-containing protein n=1 Tax=Heligmosomoides polygyrus TaxID=6339 RepID=A0A183GTI0_HELPZ|nr:unnamed protein product [Heligmosomoides polygyrus]
MVYTDDPNLHRCRYNNRYPWLGVFGRPLSFAVDAYGHISTSAWLKTEMDTLLKGIENTDPPQQRAFEVLQYLSDKAEAMCDEDPTISMLLLGLERCTPPRETDNEAVVADMTAWVASAKSWGERNRSWIMREMRQIESSWAASKKNESDRAVKWETYRNDPLRWGTTGGGPRSKWDGERTERTKWAWALAQLRDGKDIYSQALKLDEVAHVALKQEPTKTRLVITTPMGSYLRQSYMAMRAGHCPDLSSPLTSQDVLTEQMASVWQYYVSVDAKSFDHQIPRWFVEEAIMMVSRVAGVPDIGREEIAALRRLRVATHGRTVRYRGGVLSGWRLTSFIGTLASEIFCQRVSERSSAVVRYLVQGDDVLLFSNTPISEVLSEVAAEFQLVLKHAPVDAPTGIFLQRTLGRGYSHTAFGRAVRQLFYAYPWLERHLVKLASCQNSS